MQHDLDNIAHIVYMTGELYPHNLSQPHFHWWVDRGHDYYCVLASCIRSCCLSCSLDGQPVNRSISQLMCLYWSFIYICCAIIAFVLWAQLKLPKLDVNLHSWVNPATTCSWVTTRPATFRGRTHFYRSCKILETWQYTATYRTLKRERVPSLEYVVCPLE